jgi:serine protease AprX
LIAIFTICFALGAAAQAATLSPTLQSQLSTLADDASVGTVIVTFKTDGGLKASNLDLLRSVGITRGWTLQALGMVAAPATAGQVRQLAANSAIRSIWSNDRLYYFDNQARTLAGVDKLRSDTYISKTFNGGFPVNGKGITVVINDSGIDATHNDLKYPDHVIQNVQILSDASTGTTCTEQTGCIIGDGFTPLVYKEDVPNTDTHVGHGTHCAGIVGGSGVQSGGLYSGVAPGARLIGTGSGAGLFILNALGGYNWSLGNQGKYAIRIISNSWGSSGSFNPDNPINVATFLAYDQYHIVSVFAAGNSGPGWDTHNPYAKAPWVISVGAGTKEGGLASFSSRGTPKEDRLSNGDPNDDYDAPTIVAPGTGREFESNIGKFTSDIISTRAISNIVSNGLTADEEIQTTYLPFYTQISGTSMATPHVAGVVALMLSADPTLMPDEVKQILQETATRMPNYEEFQVGAGYVNAYAAVDKVFHRAKGYGIFSNPAFNTDLTSTWSAPTNFSLLYIPQPVGPQSTNTNTYRFTVEPGRGMLNMVIKFGTNPATAQTGNSMAFALYPPGCQAPQTNPTAPLPACAYSSGVALPALDAPNRQIVVKNPVPGEWVAEIRGVRGLAAVPEPSSPVGIAAPEEVNGYFKTAIINVETPADIQGHQGEQQIRDALANRRMDTFADNTFQPNANVTREDFARALALNTPLRQSLGATAKFTDVSGDLEAIAQAVTAKGSTLRDWNFVPAGMMSATGSTFSPTANISRLDLAVAFVRALGLDKEARDKAGSTVTAVDSDGQTKPILDNAQIPSELRGYVQIAIDKGFLEVAVTSIQQTPTGMMIIPGPRVNPTGTVTRAALAAKLNTFAQRFIAGN